MRFIFLGTSAGMPTRERNVTALALQLPESKTWALVDCGEGTQRQLYASLCSLAKIDRIYITHLHGDHVLGLPGLLSSRALLGATTPLTIFGPPGLKGFVELCLAALHTEIPFPLSIQEWGAGQAAAAPVSGFTVTALPLHHNVPSCAYLWQELAPRRPFLAVKAQQLGIPVGPYYQKLQQGEAITLADGRQIEPDAVLGAPETPLKFIIAGDNADPGLLTPSLAGAQLLVHEATYREADLLARGQPPLHSSAKRVAMVAAAAGLPSLILTHFSPRYSEPAALLGLREEASSHFKGQLELAEDFAAFCLTRHEGLQRLP